MFFFKTSETNLIRSSGEFFTIIRFPTFSSSDSRVPLASSDSSVAGLVYKRDDATSTFRTSQLFWIPGNFFLSWRRTQNILFLVGISKQSRLKDYFVRLQALRITCTRYLRHKLKIKPLLSSAGAMVGSRPIIWAIEMSPRSIVAPTSRKTFSTLIL